MRPTERASRAMTDAEKKRKQIAPHEAQRLAAEGVLRIVFDVRTFVDVLEVPYELTQEERRLIWNERERILEMLRALRGPPIRWPARPKCPKCGELAESKERYPTDTMNYPGEQKWTCYPCRHTVWGLAKEEPWPPENPDSFQTIPAGYKVE